MKQEIRKYFNYVKNQIGRRGRLNFLILYVTSGCNFQCRTCFFHGNLNKKDDMPFEDFERISKNLGRFSILLIGGGEPFLRPDLEDICSLFITQNKVDTLYIPTNGFLTDKIVATVESLLKKFPDIALSINPSLDGLQDFHEKTRGVAGSFDRVIETIEKLSEFKKRYKNFQIIVNSVIHRENFEDLKQLAIFLRKFDLDYHAFEILRGQARDEALQAADPAEIKKMHDFILANRRWYLERRRGGFLNKIAVLGQLGYAQYLKERVLAGRPWPFSCAAGQEIAVIYPNGDVALCELLAPVGNLKDYNFDLKKVLASPAAQEQLKAIKKISAAAPIFVF